MYIYMAPERHKAAACPQPVGIVRHVATKSTNLQLKTWIYRWTSLGVRLGAYEARTRSAVKDELRLYATAARSKYKRGVGGYR